MVRKRWSFYFLITWFCVGITFSDVVSWVFDGVSWTRTMAASSILAQTADMTQYSPSQYSLSQYSLSQYSLSQVSSLVQDATRENEVDENQGRTFYNQGNYLEAIAVWQRLLHQYISQQDVLAQARIMSNLSLTYQKLGHWTQAQSLIADSVTLLQSGVGTVDHELDRLQGLAQALNTQASLEFALGQIHAALATWDRAIDLYKAVGDERGCVGAQLNYAQALQELGYHRRAVEQLTQINARIPDNAPDSLLRVSVLRQLGDVLYLVGELDQAQQILAEGLAIANQQHLDPEMGTEIAAILLSMGKTQQALGDYESAGMDYQQALTYDADPSLRFHIELAQIQMQISLEQWLEAQTIWLRAKAGVAKLPRNRDTAYAYIDLGRQLTEILSARAESVRAASEINDAGGGVNGVDESTEGTTLADSLLPDQISGGAAWIDAIDLLIMADQIAQEIGDRRTESFAIGYLGYVYELIQDWSTAKTLTYRALRLAQSIQTADILYQWQWQLGRILEAVGDQSGAIAAYTDAVNQLSQLRQNLLTAGLGEQFRFQAGVEPLYRDLVDLLLAPSPTGAISQTRLTQARDVMEALQLAELDNFFQEACLDNDYVQVDAVDPQAAVIYPIILRDRLDVIVSLPQQPLQHFSTAIAQQELIPFINAFRNNLVIRSRFNFRAQTRQLYDWLLRPVADLIDQSHIKTLVFVLDGPLCQIPMAVLNDGDRYVIERYQIAVAPGLTLVDSTPLHNRPFRALIAGLSQARQGFSPLPYVDVELHQIRHIVSGSILLNEGFTSQTLQRQVTRQSFPIVHIASHGQFSSKPENTFIIAWDKPLKIDELRHILQSGQQSQRSVIDLLVLSACETATGDPKAPLGLAGMAVRAGARSTVATLWSVNDGVTAQFMAQFYRYLSTGESKAEALRQSQLWLLQNDRFAHPVYWAPYVLIGNWH